MCLGHTFGRRAAPVDGQRRPTTRPTRGRTHYVHAKIAIVDDRRLTLGSANLNEHSLFNDTEVNVVTDDAALSRDTRLRLWSEHLELDPAAFADRPPHEVVDELWRPIAEQELARMLRGAPRTHRLTRLPHVSRRSRRLLGPLDSFLVDG